MGERAIETDGLFSIGVTNVTAVLVWTLSNNTKDTIYTTASA